MEIKPHNIPGARISNHRSREIIAAVLENRLAEFAINHRDEFKL